jgi:hypothetical protein
MDFRGVVGSNPTKKLRFEALFLSIIFYLPLQKCWLPVQLDTMPASVCKGLILIQALRERPHIT